MASIDTWSSDAGSDDAFEWNTAQIVLTALIPLIAGVVGWLTNVVALQMMFYPLEFIGCYAFKIGSFPFFGWQGIIPGKAPKMAETAITLITTKLISVAEIMEDLEPEAVAIRVVPQMRSTLRRILERVGQERAGTMWSLMPDYVKDEMVTLFHEETPEIVMNLFEQLRDNFEEAVDLKEMAVNELTENKAMLNTLFQEVGAKEFTFIRRSGFVFGFIFGVFQMLAWLLYQGWWVLPVFGLIVGWLTNYLALKIIFEPVEPRKCCCCVLQGLFLKRQRQDEISDQYAEMVARDILNPHKVFQALTTGSKREYVWDLLYGQVSKVVDKTAGAGKTVLIVSLGVDVYNSIKMEITDDLFEDLPRVFGAVEEYAGEVMDMEHKLSSRLKTLSSPDFEGMLHPVFQEDELTLIIVGALLGMGVGFIQGALQVAST